MARFGLFDTTGLIQNFQESIFEIETINRTDIKQNEGAYIGDNN